jgi:hypothetical protein
MSDQDPVRLVDAVSEDESTRSLKRLIEEGRKELPSDAQLAALAGKLAPVLGGGGGAGGAGGGGASANTASSGATASSVTGAGVAKGVAIVAIAGASIATAWQVSLLSKMNGPSDQRASPSSGRVVDRAAIAAPPALTADPAIPPTVFIMPSSLPLAMQPPPPSVPRPDAGLLATPAVRDEVTLLQRATKALPTNPAETLAICNQAAARYPKGILAQEREVLAIRALMTLGRTKEATARADAFKSKYPSSAHIPGVDRILSDPDSQSK